MYICSALLDWYTIELFVGILLRYHLQFKEFRSDKKYSLKWIEQFLNDLLKSEWRDKIANDWYKPDKAPSVQGNIIGCLKKAGVINGSNTGIASAIIKGTYRENKTFATYMGRGKDEPYCDWICKYINL